MHHTYSLIARFMLGAMTPLAAIGFIAIALFILSPMLQIPPHIVVLVITIVILIVLKIRFLADFHFWKHSSTDLEYGINPPTCNFCHYDLRATPDYCPQCGQEVDRVDGTIIRYLISLRRRDLIDSAMNHTDIKAHQFHSSHQ